MLESLRFVQGAVAHKDFVAALTHFRIEKGLIKGFNGMIGLCSPIDMNLDITPNAEQFVKAIRTCKDTIQLHVTKAGKLSIKSGQYKALINCLEKESFPEIVPEGKPIEVEKGFLNAIKKLELFIVDDASRQWSRGILFRGKSAYATNNIILAEVWLGYDFPVEVNIPRAAINELLRINEEPSSIMVSENRITFLFSGDRWLCSQTLSTQWPDVTGLLNKPSNALPVPLGLFQALADIAPFTDTMEKVYFQPGLVSSDISSSENGASVELETINFSGIFNYKQILLLDGVANKIDFSTYPAPCAFFGENIRGVIIGMRPAA